MGVILNITNFNYGDAYFNDQAITNGFEIKENGTLKLFCRGETMTVNGITYNGYAGGGAEDGFINNVELDVSNLNEINVEYTYEEDPFGIGGAITEVAITITGVKNAIIELKPFLTNIANAIRTKKGTTAQINAQDFASEIESIEGGGGGLKGYTARSDLTMYNFACSILEDGTLKTTYDLEDKCVVIVLSTWNSIKTTVNCTATLITSEYIYILQPTDNDWYFEIGPHLGGGAGGE